MGIGQTVHGVSITGTLPDQQGDGNEERERSSQ